MMERLEEVDRPFHVSEMIAIHLQSFLENLIAIIE